MGVRLTVHMKAEQGAAQRAQSLVLNEPVITIGRDPASQVVLAQTAVSRSHARISQEGDLFFIEDLGSSYGTRLNGESLRRGVKRLINPGDQLTIAQFDITFEVLETLSSAPGGAEERTSSVARRVVKDLMKGLASGADQPFFRVMSGEEEGRRIDIPEAQEFTMGRDESADVVLKSDLISRRHCRVRRDLSGTHLEDLGSRNGFKVNKVRTKLATLEDRDEIDMGGIRLLYLDPSVVREPSAPAPPPSIEDDEVEQTNALRPEDLPKPEPSQPSQSSQPSGSGAEEQPETPEPSASDAVPGARQDEGEGEGEGEGNGEEGSQGEGGNEALAPEEPGEPAESDGVAPTGFRALFDLSDPKNVAILAVVLVALLAAAAVGVLLLVGF